ncbi:MAG: hypothetical protein ACKO34_09230 [Vampirovibrionales bacterium]
MILQALFPSVIKGHPSNKTLFTTPEVLLGCVGLFLIISVLGNDTLFKEQAERAKGIDTKLQEQQTKLTQSSEKHKTTEALRTESTPVTQLLPRMVAGDIVAVRMIDWAHELERTLVTMPLALPSPHNSVKITAVQPSIVAAPSADGSKPGEPQNAFDAFAPALKADDITLVGGDLKGYIIEYQVQAEGTYAGCLGLLGQMLKQYPSLGLRQVTFQADKALPTALQFRGLDINEPVETASPPTAPPPPPGSTMKKILNRGFGNKKATEAPPPPEATSTLSGEGNTGSLLQPASTASTIGGSNKPQFAEGTGVKMTAKLRYLFLPPSQDAGSSGGEAMGATSSPTVMPSGNDMNSGQPPSPQGSNLTSGAPPA